MLFMVCLRFTGSAQVSVSSDGLAADPSAMLDVKSSNKGFLPPRISLQATNLALPVENPATGLLIYNTATSGQPPVNVSPGYYFWNGTAWVAIALQPGSLPGEMLYWNGSRWVVVQAGLPGQFLQLSQTFVPTWVGNAFATVLTSEASAITEVGAITGGTVAGDGGAAITQRGICFSTSPEPTIGDTAIECGSGTGSFSFTLTGLLPATTYFVRAYAISSVGTAYGNEISFNTVTPPPPCPGIPTVVYEGKTYHTLMIGAQCWLRENLNAGLKISNTTQQTNNGILEKYCYDNLESNCDIYGGLYQWAEAVQYLNGASNLNSWNPPPAGSVTGICPPGWSLPTKTDWDQLADYLGGEASAGGKMKEAGYSHWSSPNTGATNTSGFTGLPGGWKHMDNYFSEIMLNGSFWTSTEWSAASSYVKYLRSAFTNLGSTDHYKKYGYSVRCVKDTCSGYAQAGVSINASSSQVCSGEAVTLTAVTVNGGSNPVFQWKVNNMNVGTSSPTYTYTPSDNDQVVCFVTSNQACVSGNPATSNTIILSVSELATASVTVTASVNPVCSGTSVTFSATPVNGGTAPYFQWKVNNVNAGTSSPSYTYIPASGDQVNCVMISDMNCVTGNPATSNTISTTVIMPAPVSVSITASANPVTTGTPVTFTASPVNGGTSPFYQWKVNGANTGDNTSSLVYTPDNNDIVACVLISSLTCVSGNPSTSNAIAMTVLGYTPCPGMPTVTHGGKTYNTVYIGTQCWFRENLDIGTRINGAIDQSDNGILEKYCYNDLESNCNVYGGLYQWNEMMQYMSSPVGICPQGWHVPSDAEWNDLQTFLGVEPGGKMKEAGFDHWQSPNTGATNSSGFTALPGGLLYPAKNFDELQQDCYIWSSSGPGSSAPHRTLRYTTANLERYENSKTFGFSVRCIKDNCTSLLPVTVTIEATENPVCAGTVVGFTAVPVNGGTMPTYQWKVNGNNAGTNNPQFSYTPANGDLVICIITSSETCVSGNPAASNTIAMMVTQPLPLSVIIMASSNPVGSGASVTFTASPVNGGQNPLYQWKVNGVNAGSGSSSFTYVPMNNDVVTCVATSGLPCVSGNPATSNAITMQVVTPGSPCPGTPTVTYGGQVYNTVQIGSQCWFRENLNIGMKIPPTFNQTDNSLIEKYCYDDLETDCGVYGGLYQWAELVQYLNGATNTGSWSPVPSVHVQGLCPQGWHIPSDDEWTVLANQLGGESVAGGKLKETGTVHWWDPNVATNESGFTALGCGHRTPEGAFIVLHQYTNYWSSTESAATSAWSRALGHWSGELWHDVNYEKTKGFSVRCLKN